METFALVAYPLSRSYRNQLADVLGGEPKYLLLSDLRREPLPRLLRRLRRLRAGLLVIPLEDENSLAILPVLSALAAVATADRMEVVRPDLSRQRLSRAAAVGSLLRAAVASASGAADVLRCGRELDGLMRQPRLIARYEPGAVLYLKTNLWFGVKAGGSVGHIAGVVNELSRRQHGVEIASAEPAVMLDPEVAFLPLMPPSVFGLPTEVNLYRFQRATVRQLAASSRLADAKLVYQRLSVGNYAGVLLSRLMSVPLVLEYNGSEAWVAKNWGRQLRFHSLAVKAEDVCLRHAHTVVTVSDVLRDELVQRGVEPARVATYPNCVDPDVFNPRRFSDEQRVALRSRYGIDPEALLVTFIGTFGQWHGVEVFARAIRLLVDAHLPLLSAHGVHFMLVGDGLKWPEVAGLLSDDRYQPFVTLTGLVEQADAPVHLAASDVLVSPHVPNADGSRFFGSPTKLFEYMAMGKPIIASDLDQIGDIFEGSPGASALVPGQPLPPQSKAVLVRPGSVEELAEGIRLLVDEPKWREQLGVAAQAEVVSKYQWRHHVDVILNTLTSVVDS